MRIGDRSKTKLVSHSRTLLSTVYCLLSQLLYIHPYSPFRKRTKTGSIARGEDHDDINNNHTGDSDNVANDKH